MRAYIAISALILSACAQPPTAPTTRAPVLLQTEFNANQARALLADGVNVVKGNAFMRQRGGGVVTCAGSTVYLIPATEYAKRRFSILYGPDLESGASNTRTGEVKFQPDPPDYYSMVKTAKCDAQGNFTFDRVADGEFFVHTTVAWQVAGRLQGGNLMHRVRVSGGQVANLVISS